MDDGKYRLLSLTFLLVAVVALPVWAAHPDAKSELENLKERIELLEAEKTPEILPEKPVNLAPEGRKIRLSGLLELEAVYQNTEGDTETSDLTLSTMELAAETNISNNIIGHIILLWEEDDTDPINIDEAVITINGTQTLMGQTPTFSGGKMYLPFGKFSSYMISDPLTLELGETNNTLVLFSLEGALWTLRTGIFNGDTDRVNDHDNIDSWVAALELSPAEGVVLGASYLSDLAESDNGLVTDPATGAYTDSVAGAGFCLSLQQGAFNLDAEYILALDNFSAPVVALGADLSGKAPSAWNLELAWRPNDQWQVAVRTEGASDFQQNNKRYGTAVSYGLFENTLLALEYLRSDDNAAGSHPVHTLTMQLALAF